MLLSRLLRSFGFVRLRDFNLVLGEDGALQTAWGDPVPSTWEGAAGTGVHARPTSSATVAITVEDDDEDEWEWQLAMARAKATAETPPPPVQRRTRAARGTRPTPMSTSDTLVREVDPKVLAALRGGDVHDMPTSPGIDLEKLLKRRQR